MLTPDQIKTFIAADQASPRKKAAQVGQDYYDGKHDILDRIIVYVDGNGKLQEDTLNSNIKIAHPYFTENADQKVQYIYSGDEPLMQSDIPQLQEILDERFNNNDDFMKELYDVTTGSTGSTTVS